MENKRTKIIRQIELAEKVKSLSGIGIVSCCNCGSIILHDIKIDDVECPYCDKKVNLSDCEDYLYRGIENNQEFSS